MGKRSVAGIAGIVVVALVIGIGWAWRWYDAHLAIKVPSYPKPASTAWLAQNWEPGPRTWYHHADQGTLTFGMPLEWFEALNQPALFAAGRLSDPAYLDGFGFIPDADQPDPAKLPVGFAHGGDATLGDGSAWRNPQTGQAYTSVGLTCAACHTGRLTYQGRELLIDGGPALTNLVVFRQAVGEAVLFTRKLPWRFEAFQARVLGDHATPVAKAALKAQLDAFLADGQHELDLVNANAPKNVAEGFGRLDALNRIGNQVFSKDMGAPANYAPISAPVHFPRIWQASWFTWVQYNGSIAQPMVRNAGEALGVAARFTASGPNIYSSSVNVRVIDELEQQLAGQQPTATTGFTGLRPPRWKDTPLPPIDTDLARRGATLYAQHCQECHLAPTSTPAFWADKRWKAPNAAGQRYLDLEQVPLEHIGTDSAEAAGMQARTVQIPAALGIKETGFGPALGDLVEKTVTRWYDTQKPSTPQLDRDRMNGFRTNGIRAVLAYKVRPLDGVWATPPYLHNGSVPTVYDLLSPWGERQKTFTVGGREYDPVHLGYRTDPIKNGFLFDTSLPGNSNRGHEFSNTPGPGVIGPELPPADRLALIEYLKTQ